MKFKYFFAFILLLSSLLLLGTVMASENIDYNANSSSLSVDSVNDNDLVRTVNNNQNNSFSTNEVDLSVDMELGDVKKTTYGINEMSFDVPLIIHAAVGNGTAKNTKVHLIIPEEFEFISSSQNIGTYDHESKIWSIGDLQSGSDATLTILTKINTKGNFVIYVNATTDSTDTDLSNNNLKCDIEVTSKISSNTTRTSAQQNEAQHNTHYASIAQGANRQINWENLPQPNANTPNNDNGESQNNEENQEQQPTEENNNNNQNENSNENPTDTQTDSGEGNNQRQSSQGENEEQTSRSVSKGISSNIFTNAANTLSNVINSIFSQDSESDDANPFSSKIVKAIAANDYRTIAILIFGLFLVILICNLGYEKIKS